MKMGLFSFRHRIFLWAALGAATLSLPGTAARAGSAEDVFGRGSTASSAAFASGISFDAKVTVQVVQRPLDKAVVGGLARAANSQWVHVQIIARDEHGRILDSEDIGYFADDENGIDRGGSVRGEMKAFDYDPVPRYEATCSYADYYAVKQESKKRFQDAGLYKWNQYSPRTTGNVRDNPSDRMSMAEFEANCQAFAEYFTDRLDEKPSCVTSRFYSPPGQETGTVNPEMLSSLTGSTTSRQEPITVAGTDNASAVATETGRGGGMQSVPNSGGAVGTSSAIPAEVAQLAGQVAAQVGEIQSQRHACTSFKFEKNYIGADRKPYMALYRCTECGQGTTVNLRDGETIEDKIAQNKQRAAFDNQAYGFAQGALQALPGAMSAQSSSGCTTPDAGVADILNEHGLMAGSALLSTMTERGEGPLAHYNTQPTQENP